MDKKVVVFMVFCQGPELKTEYDFHGVLNHETLKKEIEKKLSDESDFKRELTEVHDININEKICFYVSDEEIIMVVDNELYNEYDDVYDLLHRYEDELVPTPTK